MSTVTTTRDVDLAQLAGELGSEFSSVYDDPSTVEVWGA